MGRPFQIAAEQGAAHGEQYRYTITKRGDAPHGYQCVHIWPAVHQALKATDKKSLINYHNQPGQQHFIQTDRHWVFPQRGWNGPAPHFVTH